MTIIEALKSGGDYTASVRLVYNKRFLQFEVGEWCVYEDQGRKGTRLLLATSDESEAVAKLLE